MSLWLAANTRALNNPEKNSIPIIALTANIIQDEKKKCLETGMN